MVTYTRFGASSYVNFLILIINILQNRNHEIVVKIHAHLNSINTSVVISCLDTDFKLTTINSVLRCFKLLF